jgi:ELWxxDGT repeat protein
MLKLNNHAIFGKQIWSGGDELWTSDGTLNGTQVVKPASELIVRYGFREIYNNELYFDGFDSTNGNALWKTDGTYFGTQLVKDIHQLTGWNDGGSHSFKVFNGKLFFASSDTLYGNGLYISDGTSNGTNLLKDVGNGNKIFIDGFTEFKNELYFTVQQQSSSTKKEIWVTDGTNAGTRKFIDIEDYFGLSNLNYIFESPTVLGNQLFFVAGEYLFRTEGTIASTILLTDTTNGLSPADFQKKQPIGGSRDYFTAMNNKLYFVASDSSGLGGELWVSDGSVLGTRKVKDIMSGPQGNTLGERMLINNSKLLFVSSDLEKSDANFKGYDVWISDGTSNGTQILKKTNSDCSLANFSPTQLKYFTKFEGDVLFKQMNVDSACTWSIYRTDGSVTGTFPIIDSIGLSQGFGINFNNRVYFIGQNGHLWQSGGAATNSNIIKPVGDTNSVIVKNLEIGKHVILGNRLIFYAAYGDANSEIWALTTFPLRILAYEKNDFDFAIYPNPSSNLLNILTKEKIIEVLLFDVTGKKLLSTTRSNIDVSKLMNGTYIIKVKTTRGFGSSTLQVSR